MFFALLRIFYIMILKYVAGDTLEMKKPHACGERRFFVSRAGSDVMIVCLGCKRELKMDRLALDKAVKRVLEKEEPVS